MTAGITKAVAPVWLFLLAEGLLLVLLGVAAISLPPLFGILFVGLLGWFLIVSGVVSLVLAFLVGRRAGFVWSVLSCALTMTVGCLLFFGHQESMPTIALALAIFLLLDGFFSIMVAMEHRRHLEPKWIWLLATGTVDLFLALLMLVLSPGMDPLRLGAIIGIDMAAGGLALIVMGLDVRGRHYAHARNH